MLCFFPLLHPPFFFSNDCMAINNLPFRLGPAYFAFSEQHLAAFQALTNHLLFIRFFYLDLPLGELNMGLSHAVLTTTWGDRSV